MKRSEMLKQIDEALRDSKFRDPWSGEWHYDADDILEIVESLGMLPPLQDHIYPRLFKRDNEYVNIDSLEWEPEDD